MAREDVEAGLRGWLSSMLGGPVDTAKLAANAVPAWSTPNDPQLAEAFATAEADIARQPGDAPWFAEQLRPALPGESPWADQWDAGGFWQGKP